MEKEKQLVFLENSKGIVKTKDKIGHLYILSDEEIKENEFDKLLKQGLYFESSNGKIITNSRVKTIGIYKKIIATTDKSLNINLGKEYHPFDTQGGLLCTRLCPFPHPSQSFINKFVEKWNSNTPIKFVNVEYDCDHSQMPNKVIDVLKVDKNNEITITPIKDSWSREEVIALLTKSMKECEEYELFNHWCGEYRNLNKWLEENL